MLFIFSTQVSFRHLWPLEAVVFLHWCLKCVVTNFVESSSSLYCHFILSSRPSIDQHSLRPQLLLNRQLYNSKMNWKKVCSWQSEQTFGKQSGVPQAPALLANIILGWKRQIVTNTTGDNVAEFITTVSFYTANLTCREQMEIQ